MRIGWALAMARKTAGCLWCLDISTRRRRSITDLQQAQAFGKVYTGSLDQAGAMDAAHHYAADILAQFGGQSLIGSTNRLRFGPHGSQRNLGDELGRDGSAPDHEIQFDLDVSFGVARRPHRGVHDLCDGLPGDSTVFARYRAEAAFL